MSSAGARDRQVLSLMVMQLFDHWQITTADQCMLLGLAPMPERRLHSRLSAPDQLLLERCEHLPAIHKSLRILYPENRELVYSWRTHPHQAFGDQRPIDYVRKRGFEGLAAVRRYLDSRRSL